MPFARRVAASAAASTPVGEVDRADDQRALRRVGDERRGAPPTPRPSRRGAPTRRGVRATHQLEPAAVEHPLDLVGEQEQRRQRGRVVGLLLARVLERDRRARGTPAASGPSAPSSCSIRSIAAGLSSASQSPPSEPKRLLRREVVGVGLARRRRAGRRRPRWRRSGPALRRRPPGARTGTMTPVEVSLCAQAITSASGSATGVGASPGSASITIGSARNGAPAVALANFGENSP